MNNGNKICRLCLKTCSENFESIQDNSKEILEVLHVNMDFDISEDCVNCKKCTEMLQKCFKFKLTCNRTEDKLISFLQSRNMNKTNMSLVYLEHLQKSNSDPFIVDEICRFCMKPVTNFFALDEIVDEYFKDMLQKFLPEVTINITNNPVSCDNCLDSLKSYFTFLKRLQHVEDHIKAYCEVESEIKTEKVDLNNVVQHILNKISLECVDKETSIAEDELIESYFSGLTVTEKCIQGQDQENIRNLPIKEIKEVISDKGNYSLKSPKKENCGQNCIKTEEIETKTEETVECNVERSVHLEKTVEEISNSENFCLESSKKEDCIQNCIKSEEIEIKTVESDDDTENYRNEENSKNFQCSHCTFKGSCRNSLSRHIRRVHGLRLLYCDRCIYKTYHEDSLKKHQGMHANKAKYKCPQCQKGFGTRTTIDNHFLKGHDNLFHLIKSKIYSCNICSYKTIFQSQLVMHDATHSGLKKYPCNNCTRTFQLKNNLKRHVSAVHLNLRPHVCKVCKKTFHKKCSLDGHIVSCHPRNVNLMNTVSSKIYYCEFCTFKCINKYVMARHTRVHNK